MESPVIVDKERRRFYDGGLPPDDTGAGGEPADPTKDILVVLDRQLDADQREVFVLKRRIAYDDRQRGELIVPPAFATFKTDLTSVPAVFAWLVPKTGAHLPAALLHDGLVWNPKSTTQTQTYISTAGNVIDRVEADRIFRDGMADTGTGLVRRWLVWTAVTLATMLSTQDTSPSKLWRAYYRIIVVATLFSVAWLGYVSTADLFDRTDDWPLTYELSWMADRSFAAELVIGAAGAIVIPAVMGLLWGKFRAAGWIAGIGVALLLHVTIGVLAVTLLYLMLEWIAGTLPPVGLLILAAAVVGASAVIFITGVL